jgi:hypothetical protein
MAVLAVALAAVLAMARLAVQEQRAVTTVVLAAILAAVLAVAGVVQTL